MRAAAYLRVSSEKQADEDRFGYHRQITSVREYASRAGLEVVREYRDAITGKSVTRAGLDALARDADAFDAVIISSVDRLARDVTSSYAVLANLLTTGVQVHSADAGLIDLDRESSLIQFNLSALFAHLERVAIVKRTRSAVNAIAASGMVPDGMNAYGYRTVKRAAVIVPEEAAVVREMYERSAGGMSLVRIAETMNAEGALRREGARGPWRWTTLRKMIKSTTYKGEYRWRELVIPVPAIVDVSLWTRAQPRGRGRPWHTSPLQLLGHVRCGKCGNRLSTRARAERGRTYYSYRCIGSGIVGVRCRAETISGKWLDPIAEEAVRSALSDPARVREMLAAASEVEDRNAGLVLALEQEDARWLEAFRSGAITARELGEYRADVRRRLRALADTRVAPDKDVREYARAAKRMPLRELLDLASVEIIVRDRFSIEVRLNADGAKILP
jgi:site-specific DNA recombinase